MCPCHLSASVSPVTCLLVCASHLTCLLACTCALCRNSVGDRGVKSLVEALERNTSLQRLELQSNSITMVGCRLLSTVLRDRNMSVRRLLMGNNDADDPVIEVSWNE